MRYNSIPLISVWMLLATSMLFSTPVILHGCMKFRRHNNRKATHARRVQVIGNKLIYHYPFFNN